MGTNVSEEYFGFTFRTEEYGQNGKNIKNRAKSKPLKTSAPNKACFVPNYTVLHLSRPS
jgi:hypothetical protein